MLANFQSKIIEIFLTVDHNFALDSCDEPTIPVNGNTLPSSGSDGRYHVGYNVTFSCDTSFTISGNTFSICQENFTWSHQAPHCNPSNEMNC